MQENNEKLNDYQLSEYDYCPICGQLATGEKKHQCPKHIIDEICKDEELKSKQFHNDNDKSYSERLDDAEFMMNYFENDLDCEEE